jgi:hypothetical protein
MQNVRQEFDWEVSALFAAMITALASTRWRMATFAPTVFEVTAICGQQQEERVQEPPLSQDSSLQKTSAIQPQAAPKANAAKATTHCKCPQHVPLARPPPASLNIQYPIVRHPLGGVVSLFML